MLRQDGREGDVALASDGSLAGLAMPPPVATRTRQAEPDGFSRESEPAAPLAAPLSDIRIKAATAITFRVKAGQYIQIIDIDGRQCSDFLAFDAALLDQGIECGLDATATRTLMGRAYPGPGLHSKFFDQRHAADCWRWCRTPAGGTTPSRSPARRNITTTWAIPAMTTARRTSTRVLAPFGIASRPGWPAINFFFNTVVDGDGAIGLDEPWSRPGDYVLMRALDRSRLRHLVLRRRHRPRQWLGPDRHPCSGL